MNTPANDFSARRVWASRLLIGIVLFFNLQAAVVFLWDPALYLSGFELEGIPGQTALRGIGILFLMWNVPYAVALTHPVRRRVSLYEAIAMQAVGVVGESVLLLALPAGYAALRASILRFILFDSAGLVLLLSAWAAVRSSRSDTAPPSIIQKNTQK